MEIEIKSTFDNKAKLIKALKSIGAQQEKAKHQIDEYYNHPSRDTRKTNEYIRLRYKFGEDKGIFAHHINISDGVNKEFEVPVENIKIFKEILKNLNFPLLGTIDKKRDTFKFKDFIITIDEVKGIGNFLEVELDGEESEINSKKARCVELLEKLNIPKKNICKGVWLCDIATGKIKYP